MSRILITGATGSLGRRLAIRAAAAGHSVIGTHLRPCPSREEPGRAVTADRLPDQVVVVDSLPQPAERPGGTVTEAATVPGTGCIALRDGAAADGRVECVRLDIRDRDAVREVVATVRPDIVIHAAAGRDRNDWVTNADGAANVALACAGIRLVHVSSDAVFSGRAGREYTEDDRPDPVYPYGASKAAAETAVRAIAPAAAIVRTSLIVAAGDGGHEQLTYDLIAGRLDGALFTDEIRKPIHAEDLADALLELAGGDHRGVLHVAGPDAVSRYELGVLVARRDGLDASRIRSATASGRPGDVRLDIGRATELLSTRLRGAHEFMAPPSA